MFWPIGYNNSGCGDGYGYGGGDGYGGGRGSVLGTG
jgi:hypothetical protein